MTATPIEAHNFPVFINTGTSAEPVWTRIKNLNNVLPEHGSKEVDITDQDTAGFSKTMITSRSYKLTLEGFKAYDEDGVGDPGQVAVEVLNGQTGPDAVGDFLLVEPGDKGRRIKGHVTISNDRGGKVEEVVAWKAVVSAIEKPTFGDLVDFDYGV